MLLKHPIRKYAFSTGISGLDDALRGEFPSGNLLYAGGACNAVDTSPV